MNLAPRLQRASCLCICPPDKAHVSHRPAVAGVLLRNATAEVGKGRPTLRRPRDSSLSVNYRTSHQIREATDRLMPGPVSDADGENDDRSETISVFNGTEPMVVLADAPDAEGRAVAEFIRNALGKGCEA